MCFCFTKHKDNNCLSNNNTLKAKKTIRAEVKAKLLEMSVEARLSASRAIFSRVSELPCFGSAVVVGVYASLPDEPLTAEILREWSRCKTVAVPRVEGESINFYRYDAERCVRGAFGIMEPAPDAEPVSAGELDLLIVPGVAFTREGVRLGRGGGFYDRFLARPELRAFTAGVCFGVQIFDTLPSEPHDRRVDAVVCE
ncbi:MAG: 5-formyltetrahydrofolate cyclo-ligase [Alistipes sp.]|nr:5-formyltetrahydrofolate cyclo-ligase [Alistipes sp.]